MKRVFGAVVWMSFVACGPATPESATNAAVARQVNGLAQAILDRDAARLASLMSKSMLKLAREQGDDLDSSILQAFESQRAGLLAQFSSDGGVAPFTVDAVVLGSDGEFAATISASGQTIGRPVYFVLEEGEYRFSGVHPQDETEQAARSRGISRQGINAYPWSAWRFSNDTDIMRAARCGNRVAVEPGEYCGSTRFAIQSHSSGRFTCPSYQCTWFGSTCTYIECSTRPCYYQAFGSDGWFLPSGEFTCFR